jgi:Phosphoserine phosphatase RsbU, N-terminal domain
VAESVTDPVDRLRRDYAPVFLKYLTRQDEAGLEAAYELGREAMRRSIGLLEVVRVHNEAYLDVVATVRDVDEAQRVAQSASTFLLELIAAFEMAQRAFMEGRLGHTAPDSRPPGS